MLFNTTSFAPPSTSLRPPPSSSSSFLLRRSLPPSHQLRPSTAIAAAVDNRTHLSNLERVLHVDNPAAEIPRLKVPAILSFAPPEDHPVSPRSLSRLRTLLSDSSSHSSPRKAIARQWRRYHGLDNWDGLLDPLDENLRRELVRYGDMVQVAYNAFHSSGDLTPKPAKIMLSDPSYRVTRSLYTTPSCRIPAWAERVAPPWMVRRTSLVGFVAVCDSEREIRRMGRRDIVVVLRGTSTCLEWAENLRAGLVRMSCEESDDARVECGFWNLYKTRADLATAGENDVESLSATVTEEVRRLVKKYDGENLSITVTGHSLGAALAVLTAHDLAGAGEGEPPIAVFSFGGPRVGNQAFADEVERRGVKVLRVVNACDVVTKVPLLLPEELRRLMTAAFGGASSTSPAAESYVHVGRELVVDCRKSPYLRPNLADPAFYHDLEAYLHLVDGYIGANCPFRSNAKRSLVKLLHHQGSKLKRLYVTTARDLGGPPLPS